MINIGHILEKKEQNIKCCNCKNNTYKFIEIGEFTVYLCEDCYQELFIELMKEDGSYYNYN